MSIHAIQSHSIEKPKPKEKGHGVLAILAALTTVRQALQNNQLSMSLSYERLLGIRVQVQEKLTAELEKVLEIKKDAVGFMNIASIASAVALGSFFVSLAIPSTGVLMAVKLSQGKVLFSALSALGGMVSSGYTIAGAHASFRTAEIEEKNQQDKGLIDANEKTSEVVSDKMAEAVKSVLKAQEAVTEIINAIGAAMRIAAR